MRWNHEKFSFKLKMFIRRQVAFIVWFEQTQNDTHSKNAKTFN